MGKATEREQSWLLISYFQMDAKDGKMTKGHKIGRYGPGSQAEKSHLYCWTIYYSGSVLAPVTDSLSRVWGRLSLLPYILNWWFQGLNPGPSACYADVIPQTFHGPSPIKEAQPKSSPCFCSGSLPIPPFTSQIRFLKPIAYLYGEIHGQGSGGCLPKHHCNEDKWTC